MHTITVPSLANAIHIQSAVAGGSGGMRGADYDKAGGESSWSRWCIRSLYI